jgi:hypothetical protein
MQGSTSTEKRPSFSFFFIAGFTGAQVSDVKLTGASVSLVFNKNDIVNCVAMTAGSAAPAYTNIVDVGSMLP